MGYRVPGDAGGPARPAHPTRGGAGFGMVRFLSRRGGPPSAADDLDVLDEVRGEVGAKGTVVVGDGVEVKGDIKASGLVVWGAVVGALTIAGHIEIVSGGSVTGTVAARSVRVGQGASLKATLIINPGGERA
jgi:cytoskeletal protein CcmA (bactofilin family)